VSGELPPGNLLDLLDWRRRVFALYEEVRRAADPRSAWDRWREAREELFRDHPQSPVPPERREEFPGLSYFDYDPEARALAEVVNAPPELHDIATSAADGGAYGFVRFALARFELHGEQLQLELYWLSGYGGGVFLPFRDSTSGAETYGGGRYLLDTVKGADLGAQDGTLVLDFNFAYHPSCVYDPGWACPLAPHPNWLGVPIRAGERDPWGHSV
jgi:uncharacterized protein (DUF1684 family)